MEKNNCQSIFQSKMSSRTLRPRKNTPFNYCISDGESSDEEDHNLKDCDEPQWITVFEEEEEEKGEDNAENIEEIEAEKDNDTKVTGKRKRAPKITEKKRRAKNPFLNGKRKIFQKFRKIFIFINYI